MEQVVARWRCVVAFMKALSRLHWTMCVVSHHHTVVAIKMAGGQGALFLIVNLSSTITIAK